MLREPREGLTDTLRAVGLGAVDFAQSYLRWAGELPTLWARTFAFAWPGLVLAVSLGMVAVASHGSAAGAPPPSLVFDATVVPFTAAPAAVQAQPPDPTTTPSPGPTPTAAPAVGSQPAASSPSQPAPVSSATPVPAPSATPAPAPVVVAPVQLIAPTALPVAAFAPTAAPPTPTRPPAAPTSTPRPAAATPAPTQVSQPPSTGNCSPAYPGVCIAPPPPDLNCKDVPFKRFTVLPPDPHHFDTDKDGIGCES